MSHRLFITLSCLALVLFAGRLHAREGSYFQQDVLYKIEALLSPETNCLYGHYTLFYTNNSPDTLAHIYIHLYPNAYNNPNSELDREMTPDNIGLSSVYFAPDHDRGFIDHLDFRSPMQEIHPHEVAPDITMLKLTRPLPPGEQLEIRTPFRVKIPAMGYSRMGRKGENYQVTQWFPKPAVYDMNGWHPMSNRNIGEYYGEFGTFQFTLMVPQSHTTASTGVPIHEEPWEEQHLPHWDAPEDVENQPYKTIRIKAKNVHTFAWFSGKDYHKISQDVTVKGVEDHITLNLVVPKSSENNQLKSSNLLQVAHDALSFFSEKIGPYPYPQLTILESPGGAGGGMEYPMLLVIDKEIDGRFREIVTVHEIAHMWFYGALGFNERSHPWMDEGLTTLYEILYMENRYPEEDLQKLLFGYNVPISIFGLDNLKYRDIAYLSYSLFGVKDMDKPSTLHTNEYSPLEYFAHTYYKAALQLYYFRSLVGSEAFDIFMQGFYQEWMFKHPHPDVFFRDLEDHFPEHGPWFINNMLTTDHNANYRIGRVSRKGDSIRVRLRNKGTLDAPFVLQYVNTNGDTIDQKIPGFSESKSIVLDADKNTHIHLDPYEHLPEMSRDNNFYRGDQLFSRIPDLEPRWLYRIPTPGKKYLLHTPVIGYNAPNSFMPGWLFYNDPLYSHPLHFRLMPMFSTSNDKLVGEGRVQFRTYPKNRNNNLDYLELSFYGKRYAYDIVELSERDRHLFYNKLRTSINLSWTPRHTLFTHHQHRLGLHAHYFEVESRPNFPNWPFWISYSPRTYLVLEGDYQFSREQVNHDQQLNLNIQHAPKNSKISAEWNYRLRYNQRNHGLEVRAFAGYFFTHQSTANPDMRFRLNAWSGRQDYLFDHTALDRTFHGNSRVLKHQVIYNDGGFISPFPAYQSWDHLYALNIYSDFPLPLPIGAFFNVGGCPLAPALQKDNPEVVWEAGLAVSVARKHFRIFFPLVNSQEDYRPTTEHIRFTLDLDVFSTQLNITDRQAMLGF